MPVAGVRARRRSAALGVGRGRSGGVPAPLMRALDDAGVDLAGREVLVATGAVAAVGGVVGWGVIGGAVAAAGGVLVALVTAAVVVVSHRDRGRRMLERAVPDLVEAVARSLRTGASPVHALGEAAGGVSPVLARDVRVVLDEIDRGSGLAEALARWRDRRPVHAVTTFGAALTLGAATGGDRARGLDAVAATLRERQAIEAEIASASAQARASALVLAVVPVGFALVGTAADTDVIPTLTGTGAGRLCLVGGISLEVVGAVWMQRIVRAAR